MGMAIPEISHKIGAVQSSAEPIVTVGICARNCEDFIKDAIDSVANQDIPHEQMELILIDDGSEDDTLNVIKKSTSGMDFRVRIFHREWRGLGPTRNVLVAKASGKYLVFVDSDMIISEDYIRHLVCFMEVNPKVGIAGGRYTGISASLVSMLENVIFEISDSENVGQLSSTLPGTGASIFRIDALRQVGGFDESIKGAGEDMDVASRVKANGWLLHRTKYPYYARSSITWSSLWKKYIWHGYGMHYVIQKNRGHFSLYKMTPPAMLFIGLIYSGKAYKLKRKKSIFLLPIHSLFKSIAWLVGFAKLNS